MSEFALPMAVPPEGADPAAFYAAFAGRLTAERAGDTLTAWVADDPALAAVHAPVKAAMRFDPATGALHLQTWPLAYSDLQPLLGSPVPAAVTLGDVDPAAVREAVRDLYLAIGRPETAVDAFLAGEGLLLVAAGTRVGAAGPAAAPPDPARPRRLTVAAADPGGAPVNVTQLLSDGAALAGVDAALHPLLATVDVQGWLEIVVLDAADAPLAGAAYDLHLADGTVRTGATDADGRIAEDGLPPGPWAVDLPGHPSFAFVEGGGG